MRSAPTLVHLLQKALLLTDDALQAFNEAQLVFHPLPVGPFQAPELLPPQALFLVQPGAIFTRFCLQLLHLTVMLQEREEVGHHRD